MRLCNSSGIRRTTMLLSTIHPVWQEETNCHLSTLRRLHHLDKCPIPLSACSSPNRLRSAGGSHGYFDSDCAANRCLFQSMIRRFAAKSCILYRTCKVCLFRNNKKELQWENRAVPPPLLLFFSKQKASPTVSTVRLAFCYGHPAKGNHKEGISL